MSSRRPVNVFTLGAVYIQLLRLLRLEDHPTFAKPSDPSLFILRFCHKLNIGAPDSRLVLQVGRAVLVPLGTCPCVLARPAFVARACDPKPCPCCEHALPWAASGATTHQPIRPSVRRSPTPRRG